ncbi:MAG: DUF1318 domain-containing protein [Syntrophotaleaceae bacterium]
MKKLNWLLSLTMVAVLLSCVTINIYFPAEEVRNAADRIVNEVWGEGNGKPAPEQEPAAESKPSAWLKGLFGPAAAWAAQDINVSTPEIRAIKQAMKDRTDKLRPYLQAGNIGIGADGLLAIRDTAGLDLRSRGALQRLVTEENNDRLRLYREIARANDFPDKADEVQSIFADSWRQQAAEGWYLQSKDGSWRHK